MELNGHTEPMLQASREVILDVNTKKSKYMFMFNHQMQNKVTT
jgi:hypothetical protein